jgi:hypothetical protein
MTTPFLFDEKALRKRLDVVYAQMRSRAKPKTWKTGKRAGNVRVPGIVGLPFNRDQFWAHALQRVGASGVFCQYCIGYGARKPNFITLADCVFDHQIPLAHGGTWNLWNLQLVCADCNNRKGHLSYEFYIGIMAAIERWEDARDRTAIHKCMRTHGVTMRMRFLGKKDAAATAPATDTPEVVAAPMLPLKGGIVDDNW